MTDAEFDAALLAAAMQDAAAGWTELSIARAAQAAGLDLARARMRMPGPSALLMRLGQLADRTALAEPATGGEVSERLFDLLMHRIDVLQRYRSGVLALLRALPGVPATALLLTLSTMSSLRWMLEAAGARTDGWRGGLRMQGLLVVWLWTIRAWRNDDTPDLSATMATLDAALARATQVGRWLAPQQETAAPEVAVGDGLPMAEAAFETLAAQPPEHAAR